MSGPVIPNQAQLNGLNPLAYMGVRPTSPTLLLVETRKPTVNDKNYALGTFWMYNVSPYDLFFLGNLNQGVATWIPISTSAGGPVSELTSNSGGAVPPLLGNINVVGDNIGITGVGNPGTNTITFSLVGSGVAAQEFDGNTGSATPNASGVLNIVGTAPITTTASGNTITISTSGTGTVETLTGNSGGAVSPTAGNINVVGDGVTVNVVGNPGTHTLTISSTGVFVFSYTNVTTTPYVVLSSDDYLSVDSSALAITINLPNAPATGRAWIIKDRLGNAFTNNITVTTVGGAINIDGATTYVMNTNYEAINVIFNGTFYEVW